MNNALALQQRDYILRLQKTNQELLAACHACLLREDIADSDLGPVLRAAIAKGESI